MQMTKTLSPFRSASAALLLACSVAAAPVWATSATMLDQQPVAYESLENRIGADIVVHTTLKTVRRGTLVKYSNVSLTLRVGHGDGAIELRVPRETIRETLLVLAPVDPLPLNEGQSGAQKN